MKAQVATQNTVLIVIHIKRQGSPFKALRMLVGQVCDILNINYNNIENMKQQVPANECPIGNSADKGDSYLIVNLLEWQNYFSLVQPYILLLKAKTAMSKIITEHSVPEQSNTFCFKYFINLGNDRFGSMTINQKTNLYQEAENFCKIYQLDPFVAVYLENQMFQQVLKVKQQVAHKENNSFKSIGSIAKNKTNESVVELICREQQTTEPKKERSNGSILHQSINYSVGSVGDKKSGGKARRSNSRHFEEMFKRYEEIESKKQLRRKASIQKIPFKPVINNLSRKIVDLKRSAYKLNESGSKGYMKKEIRSKQKRGSEAQSKQRSKTRKIKIRLE